MNVRTICLAILYDAEATGYEIRKLSVEGEYSYFIDASYGAIYPALAKLEEGARRIRNPVAARNPAVAALYIVPGFEGGDSLFSTHPATRNRIAALQAIAAEMGVRAPRPERPRASALDPLGRPS